MHIIFFLFFFPANAYAYLDPGTGSIIIQIIIGVFAFFAATIATIWSKIINFLKKNKILKKNETKNK
jgi:hypothetical protein